MDGHGHVRPMNRSKREKDEDKSRINEYQWLNTMDNFAGGISNLISFKKGLPSDFTDLNLPQELRKNVRVALIDDGVDLMHKANESKIEDGKSFEINYEDPDDLDGTFHYSTTGHGTCMAYMIGRICPNVKIFVCKLDVIRASSSGGKANFTADSAANVSIQGQYTFFSPC